MTTTRDYEITYIIDPALDENKRGELSAAIEGKISELKGVISKTTDSLHRKLAYPVKKQRSGFVRLIQAQLAPEHIARLRDEMKRRPSILRWSIVQSAPREDVTTALFDILSKQPRLEPKQAATAKKPAPEITAEEVEEKIAAALEEEVK